MRRSAVLCIVLLLAGVTAFGQKEGRRFAVATSLGSGIALNRPAKTPFTWQVKGYYEIVSETSVDSIPAGNGILIYFFYKIPCRIKNKRYICTRNQEQRRLFLKA